MALDVNVCTKRKLENRSSAWPFTNTITTFVTGMMLFLIFCWNLIPPPHIREFTAVKSADTKPSPNGRSLYHRQTTTNMTTPKTAFTGG